MLGQWPEIGRSKTRLAASIGGATANQIYRQLLRCCSNNVLEACSLPHRRALFFVDPPERCKVMTDWLGGDPIVYPQTDGDLGKRMREAAARAFRKGGEAVIIMGSDCPQLTSARMERAFDALASHRVVIGPSADGGFYLLGMSEMVPELFRPLQWTSDQVYKRLLNRCKRLGLTVEVLETLNNIDRVSDLSDEVLSLIDLNRSEIFVETTY